MSVAKMQSVANAHNAARRMGGGARPNIKQTDGGESGRRSAGSGLTISAQRIKGPDKVTELPPINPHVNRELEGLQARVAELTEQLAAVANLTANGRVVSVLEGGYGKPMAAGGFDRSVLATNCQAHVAGLAGVPFEPI